MFSFAKFGNQLYSGERSFDIVRRQRTWYVVSAVLLLLSLGALLGRGLTLGLDFTGGSEFRISQTTNSSDIVGVDAVHTVLPASEPRVTKVGADSMRVQVVKVDSAQSDRIRTALAQAYDVPESRITQSFVGGSWGSTVSIKALQGLLVFLVLVALVISVYFRTWKMAVAAIVALVHDLLITVGIYALVGFEVTPASVIGFLTILGYSLYDTVVVFDKVRENTDRITGQTRRTYSEAANLALNQTLVRSINTSVVALLPVASILFIGAYLLGAGTLKDLSLALFVGIATGTYSSIFIATPLLADLREREPQMRALAKRVSGKRQDAPVASRTGGGRGARVPAGSGGSAVLDAEPGSAVAPGGSLDEGPDPTTRPGPPRATGPRNQPRRKNTRKRR
jgi:preprotein translocase subunit SecF